MSKSSREAWAACTACMLELMVPVKACWADVCGDKRSSLLQWFWFWLEKRLLQAAAQPHVSRGESLGMISGPLEPAWRLEKNQENLGSM